MACLRDAPDTRVEVAVGFAPDRGGTFRDPASGKRNRPSQPFLLGEAIVAGLLPYYPSEELLRDLPAEIPWWTSVATRGAWPLFSNKSPVPAQSPCDSTHKLTNHAAVSCVPGPTLRSSGTLAVLAPSEKLLTPGALLDSPTAEKWQRCELLHQLQTTLEVCSDCQLIAAGIPILQRTEHLFSAAASASRPGSCFCSPALSPCELGTASPAAEDHRDIHTASSGTDAS